MKYIKSKWDSEGGFIFFFDWKLLFFRSKSKKKIIGFISFVRPALMSIPNSFYTSLSSDGSVSLMCFLMSDGEWIKKKNDSNLELAPERQRDVHPSHNVRSAGNGVGEKGTTALSCKEWSSRILKKTSLVTYMCVRMTNHFQNLQT